MARALLIKFGAIGDVVMAIPAAHALHRSGFAIDWVCGAAVAPVLALYPWINPIPADDRAILHGSPSARVAALLRLWRDIPRERYDLCATLYYDRRYRVLALPVRARRKLMLSTTERATKLLPGRHHTDEYARILLGREDGEWPVALAPVRPPAMPGTPLPRSAGRSRILLAPAGARNLLRDDALRRWPPELYVEVARDLLQRGFEVVLLGGPEDTWVSPRFAGLAVTDCIGRFSLLETIGLLDAADVLLTHDTGPLHLAGLTAVGIVSLFGPTDPHGRLPQRPNALALWGGEGFACRPCYDGRDYAPCKDNGCMRQVTAAMAVDHILEVIKAKGGDGLPPRVVTPESTVKRTPQSTLKSTVSQ